MAINPHHTIEIIDNRRCSVVERNLSVERAKFLIQILETNNFEVVQTLMPGGLIVIGVTDILFNPIHALYSRSLKTPDGKIVTPSYWYQQKTDTGFYWQY